MNVALQVAWEFYLDPPIESTEEFHDIGNRLMDELLILEECIDGVHDSTVSTEHDRGVVLVELLVRDAGFVAALEKTLAVVRTAIHAIGGATPDWPRADALMPLIEFTPGDIEAEPVDLPAETGAPKPNKEHALV
jgi:hypothetical protein